MPSWPKLLDRIPIQDREYVVEEDKVVVLVPRFDGSLGSRVTKRLSNPNYRVHLDELGSEVWCACDGIKTVLEISHDLRRKLGEEIEPAEERVAMFVRRLERGRCIRFVKEGEGSHGKD